MKDLIILSHAWSTAYLSMTHEIKAGLDVILVTLAIVATVLTIREKLKK